MNVIMILATIWLAYGLYSMVRKEGRRGILYIVFLTLTCGIWVIVERLGYNGGIAAIVFSILSLMGISIYNKSAKHTFKRE